MCEVTSWSFTKGVSMKKLALALMFCCSAAYAQSNDWIARMPNKAGGLIVFLTFKGSCKNGNAVYGSTASGHVSWGCWIASDNHVMVFWNDGETRSSAFSYRDLEINPAFENKNNKGNTF